MDNLLNMDNWKSPVIKKSGRKTHFADLNYSCRIIGKTKSVHISIRKEIAEMINLKAEERVDFLVDNGRAVIAKNENGLCVIKPPTSGTRVFVKINVAIKEGEFPLSNHKCIAIKAHAQRNKDARGNVIAEFIWFYLPKKIDKKDIFDSIKTEVLK